MLTSMAKQAHHSRFTCECNKEEITDDDDCAGDVQFQPEVTLEDVAPLEPSSDGEEPTETWARQGMPRQVTPSVRNQKQVMSSPVTNYTARQGMPRQVISSS